jgi:hypothetical protein
VADEIGITVSASQLEVPVVGRQPGVEDLRDSDATVTKNQCAWRLLATMTCVALDINDEEPLLTHLITMRPSADRSASLLPHSGIEAEWGRTANHDLSECSMGRVQHKVALVRDDDGGY